MTVKGKNTDKKWQIYSRGFSDCFVIFLGPGQPGTCRCLCARAAPVAWAEPGPASRSSPSLLPPFHPAGSRHLFLCFSLTFPLHLFAFPSSQPVHQVHPLVMTISLVVILSSARNILNSSPLQDSRCKHHLSFPFSYFFAPISLHHLLFFSVSPPPHRLIAKDRSFS